MWTEIKAVLVSKRFWIAAAGLLFVLTSGLGLPLTQAQVTDFTLIVVAWILGDTYRPTLQKIKQG